MISANPGYRRLKSFEQVTAEAVAVSYLKTRFGIGETHIGEPS
jgi:hypothetical protein